MVKEIILTKDQVTIVDDEDYEYLSKFKWHAIYIKHNNTYYACRTSKLHECNNYKRKPILMHRIITNCNDDMLVDHVNFNTLDNRKCNLRICNHRENTVHRRKFTKTKIPYRGVYAHRNKFRIQFYYNNKIVINKSFDNVICAALYYDELSEIYYKEYAVLNFKSYGININININSIDNIKLIKV